MELKKLYLVEIEEIEVEDVSVVEVHVVVTPNPEPGAEFRQAVELALDGHYREDWRDRRRFGQISRFEVTRVTLEDEVYVP